MNKIYFILSVILLGLVSFQVHSQSTHPGVPFNAQDLAQLRIDVNSEPWKTPYQTFKNGANLSYIAAPAVEVSRAPNIDAARTAWSRDMNMAFNLSMVYALTGQESYAATAKQILVDWARVNKKWSGDEDFLDLGDYADKFTAAADILKSTYPGWTSQDTELVNGWFTNVLWPVVDVPNPTRGANQGAIQLKAAIGIAAFLQDPAKWNAAVQSLRAGASGLANSLANGQVGDSGRDEGHWRGQVEALAWCLEVVWKQGIDLYSELDNRMLRIVELYAHFHQDKTPFINQYILSGSTYACWTNWGSDGSAKFNLNAYEIIRNAYTHRKGIATPYVDMFLQRPEGVVNTGNFFYHKTSDNSTAAQLPAIVPPAVQPVGTLTNLAVGTVGIVGSSALNAGTWTVKGAGTGLPVPALTDPDGFNFAFQKQTGDVVLVTKVNTVDGPANARGGILMRESLAADSKYVGIFINAQGGVTSTWRGATAWSKTNVSWNNPPRGFLPHGCFSAPYWLKMQRIGSRVTAFDSPDGVNWTALAEVEIPMNADVHAGLGVTSGSTSEVATATFSELQMSSSAPDGSPVIQSATAASAAVGANFQYQIQASGTPTAFSADGLPAGLAIDTSTGVISGIPIGTGSRNITLGATNASGTGNAILVLDVTSGTAPAPPALTSASRTVDDRINLTWAASVDANTYTIRRSATPGGPYQQIASGVNLTFFTDLTAEPGMNYYVITAFSGELESGLSNELSAELPPLVPSRPVVNNGDAQVTLSWQAAEAAATYKVKRSSAAGGPYTEIATGVIDTSFTDQSVTNASLYYYVVSAVGITLESNNSPESLGLPGTTSSMWKVSPASKLWSDAGNWLGTVPVSPALIYFGASQSTAVLQNDMANLSVARMTFTDSAYQLAGNQFTLLDGVENNATKTQVVQVPVVLGNNVQMITNGNVRFEGVISGSNAITKSGVGVLHMNGLNTYAGGTVVTAGTLKVTGGQDGSPAGPLGSGLVTLKHGTVLNSTDVTNTYIPNDIKIEGNVLFLNGWEADYVKISGGLKGNGNITYDGSSYSGLDLNGDNSEFTGTFSAVRRSSRQRCNFTNAKAGSAKASWFLDANFSRDSQRMLFSGEIEFGAFSGGGTITGGPAPVLKIGALNTDTEFSGQLLNAISLIKVGTGSFTITGSNSNTGFLNVEQGGVFVNNSGKVSSVVTVKGGAFGGDGNCTADIIVGTGNGGQLVPGRTQNAIGTLTTTGKTTINADGGLVVQQDWSEMFTDKLVTNGLVLNNAALTVTNLGTGAPAAGSRFLVVDNTSATPVAGTFAGLGEMALLDVNGSPFRISYIGGDGNDIILLEASTVTSVVPQKITGLTATGESTSSIQVSWIKSADSDVVSAYILKRSSSASGPFEQIAELTDTVFTDTGLDYETTYYYTVLAKNYVGESPASDVASAATNELLAPSALGGLLATGADAKVYLGWTTPVDVTGYKIIRATSADGVQGRTELSATANPFVDSGVTNGITYYYWISAVNQKGEGPQSAFSPVTPESGRHLYYQFAETNGARAVDSWSRKDATLGAAAYRVQGKSDNGVQLIGTPMSFVSVPNGVMDGLTNFTASIWIRLDASNNWERVFDFGAGSAYMFLSSRNGNTGTVRYAIKAATGNEQSVTAPGPALPLNTWTHIAVTQNGNLVILYINGAEVARNAALTLNPSVIAGSAKNYLGKSQFTSDPNLNGTIDEFRIHNRALSAQEVQDIVKLNLGKPQVVTGLAATAQGATSATISWAQAPAADLVTSYVIKRATAETGPFEPVAETAQTTYLDKPLVAETTYYYQVSAKNMAGMSDDSGVASVTTGELPMPSEITNLIAAGADAKIILTWTPAADVEGYKIIRSTSSDGLQNKVEFTSGSASFMDTDVTNGTRYYYSVLAFNAKGNGPAGAWQSVSAVQGRHSYWNLNESAGNSALDSWSRRDGTLAAGAAWAVGKTGNGLKLNGTATSNMQLPAGIVNSLTNFTIAMWVKLDAATDWMRAFDFGSGTTSYMFVTVRNGATKTIRYAIKQGSPAEQQLTAPGAALAVGAWTHIAVTQNGQTGVLYVNGVEAARNTAMSLNPSSLGNTTQNWLGKAQFNDPVLNGVIDEFQIYNQALTVTEINELMANNALPVNLVHFSGQAGREGNVLSWTTAGETNNRGFEVERSWDGKHFGKIGFVDGAGTSTAQASYQYLDAKPLASAYYRLKQLDFTQRTEFSRIIHIKNDSGLQVRAFPNPVRGLLNLDVPETDGHLVVRNMAGVIVDEKMNYQAGSYDTSRLSEGTYLISIGEYTFRVFVR